MEACFHPSYGSLKLPLGRSGSVPPSFHAGRMSTDSTLSIGV